MRKNLGNKIETGILETMTGAVVGLPPKISNLIRKKSKQIAVEYMDAQEFPLLKTTDQIILFFGLLGIEKEVEQDSADNIKNSDIN